MKPFQISLPDIKYGKLKPHEDALSIKDNIFCVADGITRDPSSPLDFGSLSMEELLKNYPDPSPARMAADLFCQSFTEFLAGKKKSQASLKDGFIFANQRIRELNDRMNPSPDYLVNDYYACVASVCVINDEKLHWGYVGDCGLIVFDEKRNAKFQTPDGLENFLAYMANHSGYWHDSERRKLIRSQFRNNPEQIIGGKCVSYGALTGEKRAESFFQFGTYKLSSGDLVVVYSDGFAKTIDAPGFYEKIISSLIDHSVFLSFDKSLAQQDYEKFGKERTLVAIKL